MDELKFFKVDNLPAAADLAENSVYMVKKPGNIYDIRVTDKTGTVARELDSVTNQELDDAIEAIVFPVTSVNARTGDVVITATDVGLEKVDNFETATQAEAEAGASNSKFMTPLRTKQAIDTVVNALPDQDIFKVVSVLPDTGEENYIYIVPATNPAAGDQHDEYMWVNEAWELVGTLDIDLSDYYNKDEIDVLIQDFLTETEIGDLLDLYYTKIEIDLLLTDINTDITNLDGRVEVNEGDIDQLKLDIGAMYTNIQIDNLIEDTKMKWELIEW